MEEEELRGTKFFMDNKGCKRVGGFTNKHGEEFVIYIYRHIAHHFITGDELDWKFGWRIIGDGVVQDFYLTKAETALMREVLDVTKPNRI